jgi:tetratricopeptide (TPR) repeat protein
VCSSDLGSANALLGLGKTLYRKDALAEAEDSARKALTLAPNQGEAWCLLGLVQSARGKERDAEDSYRRSLELRPEDATALCGQAHILAREGRLEEADALLKRALERNPNHIASLYARVARHKVGPDDQELRTLRSLLSREGDLSPDDRQSIHFALGKALDDLGDYDHAFPHFLEGNRLKRLTLVFDPDADTKSTDLTISLFTRELFERVQGKGFHTDLPIFVLGMPRSGTTLTEQILASHPEVYGAGELSLLMDILTASDARRQRLPFPYSLSTLNRETVKRWGKDYAKKLREYAPRASRITNKMPANYKALGAIPLMLPEARIIHVRRNAVDTCLSCFMQSFLHGQEATYDLTDLGHHYVNYARLMEHWRSVLPEGSFLEVQYEDLVADTEAQARRLVEYCGLKWDDACLAFHKAERFVRTASISQVRQPIYRSSVERWRKYEKFLDPLLQALGQYAR